jgi:hypothetical protein
MRITGQLAQNGSRQKNGLLKILKTLSFSCHKPAVRNRLPPGKTFKPNPDQQFWRAAELSRFLSDWRSKDSKFPELTNQPILRDKKRDLAQKPPSQTEAPPEFPRILLLTTESRNPSIRATKIEFP